MAALGFAPKVRADLGAGAGARVKLRFSLTPQIGGVITKVASLDFIRL